MTAKKWNPTHLGASEGAMKAQELHDVWGTGESGEARM